MKIILLVLTCLMSAAPPATSFSTQDPTPPSGMPRIVGHRGASDAAPENTLVAFQLGFERGADAVEGDFRLTEDGRIVAMHDEDLRRTTGDPRRVEDVSYAEIRALDAGDWGRWAGSRFVGARVPSLEETLAAVPEGRGLLVEIKDSPRIVESLLETLDRSGLGTDRVTIISFDAGVVEAIKKQAPRWRALWLTSFRRRGDRWEPTVDEVVRTARRIGADGVDVKAEPAVVDREFVRRLREAGLEWHVWTVNDPALARRMAALGVDSITTDRPAAIRKALGG